MGTKQKTQSRGAKQQPAPKKPKGPKKAKKKQPVKPAAPGFFFVFCMVIMSGLLAGVVLYVIQHRHMPSETAVKPAHPVARPLHATQSKPATLPKYEIYPAEPIPQPVPLPPKPTVTAGPPRVAIIIDDIGYEKGLAEKFLHLKAVLTYSILPNSPFHRELARMAHRMGYPVMLHLPMEPMEYPAVNPGPGALLCSMTPDQRIRMLRQDLDAVPYICGVNNHMGSRMTTNSDDMNQILSILKLRGLFFIDSRTTAASVAGSSARLFHVPFARRDVFLDNVLTPAAIEKQIRELIRIAEKNGEAVGICHPHTVTYEVLAREMPEIKKKVRLVPVSELVTVIGS